MISVLGSINLDMIATGPDLPLPGQTVFASNFSTAPGGKGANQALAAVRAGARVKMVGAVGKDEFAAPALAELEASGMDLDAVKSLEDSIGIALILVDGQGENVIVIVPGANSGVDRAMAGNCVAGMDRGDTLVMVQEVPADSLETALGEARNRGIRTLLNIAPITPDTPRLAPMADIVVANETEFAVLAGTGEDDPDWQDRAALWARTNDAALIVTLGARGAMAFMKGQSLSVAAPPITPVDTVGAGDTFCGYLAAGLDRGLDLEQAMTRAVTAGALACLKPGAQPAIPHAAQVDSALRS